MAEPDMGGFGDEGGGGFGDEGASDKPFDDEPFDAGVETDESEDPKKFIQQLAGKLGQSLRSYEGDIGQADLELEKFAINSVLSATNTAEMDEEDQKDIINKVKTTGLDNDVEPEGGAPEPEGGEPEGGMEEPAPEPEADGELDAELGESLLESGDAEDIKRDAAIAPKGFGTEDDVDQSIGEEPTLNSLEEIGNFVESLKAKLGNDMETTPTIEPQVKPKTTEPKRIKERGAPFRRIKETPQVQPKAGL